MKTLESDRLILRDYKESDLAEFHSLMSDSVNMYFLPELVTRSVEQSLKSLRDSVEANAKGIACRFCVALKENDRLIGSVGYEIASKTPLGKIALPMGWFIMRPYQNKGYATEAVKAVLEYAFLWDNCIRVATGCYRQNVPTQRVMEKVGFRKEAEKIGAEWHDSQMKDRLEFAINRDEYLKGYSQTSVKKPDTTL